MMSDGHSMSNGNSFAGEGTERECPMIRRLLSPVEVRSP
jgi:hypothetical protein